MGKRLTGLSNKTAYRSAIIFFSIACIVTSFLCYQYYLHLQTTIRDESSGYLQEVSARIGSNITRIINNNYSVLDSISSYVANENRDTSFENMDKIIDNQKAGWGYESIMFIDVKGNAYTSNGESIQLTTDVYFQDSVLKKENALSMYQVINGKECVMFSIPLNHVKVDGIEMNALVSSYDASTFDQVLSMSSFSEQAYSHIISKDGTIVVRSTSSATKEMGYNILSTLKGAELDKYSDFDTLKSNIADNKNGQIGFEIDGEKYYMVYTPIDPEDWYLLTFVPMSVVNAKSNILLMMTVLLTTVVTVVFAILLAFLIYVFKRNREKLEKMAYVDDITGGNTVQRFYQVADNLLSKPSEKQYALIYTNIVKFKVMNEQFGREVCDIILRLLYGFMCDNLKENECMGRISGDSFVMLIEYNSEEILVNRFLDWFASAEKTVNEKQTVWTLPVVEFGIYLLGPDQLSFQQMIDRAQLSLKETTKFINNKMRYSIYDDNLRRKMFREKQLEDMMEDALQNNEFQVYLQPKYNVSDETIGGAEALTRWVSKEEGMIFPDEFIPLFEKNGFVVQLDLWVFKEVCRKLRGWLDEGLNPPCISINCSKVHLKDYDFLRKYRQIAEEYQIPRGLLEIELTESIVMDDSERLIEVLNQIHDAGFSVSMDDFGSGYSSLNLVQTIPVDTLKIDKIFFRKDGRDDKRMEAVVSNIISMAKALDMKTVAEGVEYPEQVKMLKKYGCDLIQGYVFARPMPIKDFENLAFYNNKK